MALLNQENDSFWMNNKFRKYFILIAIAFAGILSCSSPEKSRKLLSFFFDGVPVVDSSMTDTIHSQPGLDVSGDTSALLAKTVKPKYVLHYPYQERMCTSCHLENALGQFADTQPGLCYMCHEDFAEKYKHLHGPVSGGYCTACHNPHMSKNENLLRRTGQKLCLYCHDKDRILKGETHEGIGEMSCLECHNPHGGEDKFLFN
ncbi:MAG: hypothetical protein GXO83_07770 [Chlorobi bacterium]|nr:hypothetical protein [Chlorobiota bacterium]